MELVSDARNEKFSGFQSGILRTDVELFHVYLQTNLLRLWCPQLITSRVPNAFYFVG